MRAALAMTAVSIVLQCRLAAQTPNAARQRLDAAPIGVDAVSYVHGLRMSISLPKRAYPAGALVRANLVVTNVSLHPVWLKVDCLRSVTATVQVVDGSGTVRYGGPVQPFIQHSCLPVWPRALPAGSATRQKPFLVLAASWLRAVVFLAAADKPGAAIVVVRGAPFHVVLGPSRAPRVTFSRSARGAYADVTPLAAVSGPMYYTEAALCESATGLSTPSQPTWTPVLTGRRVYAGCDRPSRWRLGVGWLGSTSTSLDYPG